MTTVDVSKVFDCSDLSNFIASIVEILPFSGFSMSRFYTCEVQGVRFLTKVCLYSKSANEIYAKPRSDLMPHPDAEISILKLFKKKFIDEGVTPCILELAYVKVCNDLSKLVPSDEVCKRLTLEYRVAPEDDVLQYICKHHDLVRNDLAHNRCAFLVLERCDMSLDTYLQHSISTPLSVVVFKALLFMIIQTFYAIKKVYPKFHHYDLHTDNIVLKFDRDYKFKPTKPRFLLYHIADEEYYVPYFGIIPKIIDFGFSTVPEEGIISSATEDKHIMFYRSKNDMMFLFYHIYHVVATSGRERLDRIDKILCALEPTRSYVHFYTEHIRKIEDQLPTYEDMIKNNVFHEYKKYRAKPNQIYKTYYS